MRDVGTKKETFVPGKTNVASMGVNMDLMNAELVKQFGPRIVRRTGKDLEQLILLITGLRYDVNFEAMIIRCLSFLSHMLEHGIVMGIRDVLMAYANSIEKEPSIKAFSAMEEANKGNTPEASAVEVWKALKQTIFTKHLSYIVGTVFAVATCKLSNVSFSHPFYDNMIKSASTEKLDAVDLVDHLCKLYNWCATVGLACFTQRSLDPLKFNSDTLAVCHEKFYYWQNRFIEIKREQKPDSAERTKMFIEMEETVKNLHEFVKYDRDKFMTTMSSTLLRDASKLLQEIKDYMVDVDFVKAAFGVHIWGLPKAGKSTILPLLAEQICLAGGEIYDSKRCAHLNLTAQFQDEIDNTTQSLFMNESTPTKVHLAKNLDVGYTTSLAVVDNCPWHPNRSNLEDKARILLRILLALSTGNSECPWLDVAKTIAAWFRRYMLIHMAVRPEFADEEGRFDASKVDGSNDYHLFDFYELIIRPDGTQVKKYFRVNGVTSKQIDTKQLLETLRVIAMRHFAYQDALEAQHKAGKVPGCLVCKRIKMNCMCHKALPESTNTPIIEYENEVVYVPGQDDSDDEDDEEGRPARRYNFSFRKKYQRRGKKSQTKEKKEKSSKKGKVNKPEAGLAVMVAKSFFSVFWDTCMVWFNPFVKFAHIWSIDKSTTNLIREELISELEWLPTYVGTSGVSLIPQRWCEKKDGTPTLIGRLKDRYARAIAAENQIFLPLTYLFKRAVTFAILTFFLVLVIQFGCIYIWGHEVLQYTQETTLKVSRWAFRWNDLYPAYSEESMRRNYTFPNTVRRYMLQKEHLYVDEEWYWIIYLYFLSTFLPYCMHWVKYVNSFLQMPYLTRWLIRYNAIPATAHPLYRTQAILGAIRYYWFTKREEEIQVYEVKVLSWWEIPIYMSIIVLILGFLSMWHRRSLGYQKRYEEIKERIQPDAQLQQDLYDRMKRNVCEYNSYIPTAIGLVGVIATAICLYNNMRQENDPQAEVIGEKRTSWNDWFSFKAQVVPTPHLGVGRTSNENVNAIKKNIVIVRGQIGGKEREIRAMYMESGILLISRHYFKPDMFKEETTDHIDCTLECSGYVHKARLYFTEAVRIADKDMVIIFVANAPKVKNCSKDLLPTRSGDGRLKSTFIRKDGPSSFTFLTLNAQYETDIDSGGFSVGRGVKYSTMVNLVGMCGSPVVADRKDGVILGFHVAGSPGLSPGEKFGYAQEITYHDYMRAREALKQGPSFMNVPEACEQVKEKYGKTLIKGEGALPQATIFHDGTDLPGVEILGHDPTLPKYRSRVEKSLICDALEARTGVPNATKKPDMSKPWVDHNRAILVKTKFYPPPPPDARRWAQEDYLEPVIPEIKKFAAENPELMAVLTMDESINGRPNALYMKGVDIDTAFGVPLHGTKAQHLEELPPYPDGRKRYGLTPAVKAEVDSMLNHFRSGKQFDVWVKTCLKDEKVAITKKKVRIFYISQTAFTLVARMYLLPLCEFKSRFPELCECSVGINCAGPDWERSTNHIAGADLRDDLENDMDLSDYDLARCLEMTCSVLKMNRRLCEAIGYSEDQLKIVDGILDAMRNPVINWNGTIIRTHLWSSGNSFTVYENGDENGQYMRCSFYMNGMRILGPKAFHALGPYRKNERLLTYGDDSKSKSRQEVRQLTCFSAKKWFFDTLGMTVTDARKSDNPPDFVPASETDFLKRKSVYHPKLKAYVGALEKASIYRMGHMCMKSAHVEREDLAIQSYGEMLGEAFLHGEEFYEEFRSQLQLVAQDTNISSKQLDRSYDDRVLEWHKKYSSTSSSL